MPDPPRLPNNNDEGCYVNESTPLLDVAELRYSLPGVGHPPAGDGSRKEAPLGKYRTRSKQKSTRVEHP